MQIKIKVEEANFNFNFSNINIPWILGSIIKGYVINKYKIIKSQILTLCVNIVQPVILYSG